MTPNQLQKISSEEVAKEKARQDVIMKKSIIAYLGDGLTLADIVSLSGFPSYHCIIGWTEKDERFGNDLKLARLAGGYHAADKAASLVDDMIGSCSVNDKLVSPVLTHLRWVAERQARGTYGQQLEVKHSGTVHVRTSFLIPRTRQSVIDGEVIDLDSRLEPAQLVEGDDWLDQSQDRPQVITDH